ncbi:SDR family oxidoreductase [Nitriliruptoria bacterium AS10]|nr:SDR family oxidoreductase [Salsipaludibacter albus]MBY5161529.1 SDR family oxidoreductase [Salsipaludibacter albus]
MAVVTGASRGLGRALAGALGRAGWDLVLDARTEGDLLATVDEVRRSGSTGTVRAVVGDVTDADHRRWLAETAAEIGPVALLVNNASTLGPSPLPRLVDLAPGELAELLEVNTVAPLAMFQALAPHLAPDATVVNVTSDASVGAWEGWGGYGLSKAALDHLSAVLAVEHPDLAVHAIDPGDLRTAMHQAAYPGEDISDRPLPEAVVDDLVALVEARPPSGRHRLADWAATHEPSPGEAPTDGREVAA